MKIIRNLLTNHIGRSVTHLHRVVIKRGVTMRVAVALTLATLLIPTIFIGGTRKASARTALAVPPSGPASAPPEPFIVHRPSAGVAPVVLAANVLSGLTGLLAGPKMPEGFPSMKAPGLTDRILSGVGPVLGFFTATSKTAKPNPAQPPAPPPAYPNIQYDFDGDGSADIGRWHPANQEFKVRNSNSGSYTAYTLGTSSAAKAAPGDFNGDGQTDPAVFNAGTWTYKLSPYPSPTPQTISLGQAGDIPVAGYYDEDSITDAAVFRPSDNTWRVKQSGIICLPANPNCNVTTTTFGSSGDIPVPGDYDGDGVTDMAVFHASSGYGYWNIQRSSLGYVSFHWGLATDVPVQGDFDGDGKSDPAVFRPSTSGWYAAKSSTSYATYTSQTFGSYFDQPAPADYNGDGFTDYCVWRPTSGVWYTFINDPIAEPEHPEPVALGVPGDTAVPSAYTKQIGAAVTGYDMAGVRLNPRNATGGTNLYSQNFSWGTSLVSLPGRSGLDAGFGLSYNSLVWAKSGSAMIFDPDASNVTPGFRFGFPVIEPVYYDSAKAKWAYMMVTPSGGRTEFRQVGATNVYETADSTNTQIVTNTGSTPNSPVEDITITVTTTDGTQMSYVWNAGAYRCTKVKDRNGNYITIAHDAYGQMTSVTDTLGRVINVNYDGGGQPTTITQTWRGTNGSGSTTTHTWATLSYTTRTVNTDFHSSITGIFGPPDGTAVKVLDKVTYADGSFTKFEYNDYIQVKKISSIAADSTSHVLNYVWTNLDSPSASQTDCPRFTQTRTWAENFNNNEFVEVHNTVPASDSFTGPYGSESTKVVRVATTDHPDDFYTLHHFGPSGYKEGLTLATEDCVGGDVECGSRKRWTWTGWEQDRYTEEDVPYPDNPRVIETRVGDGTNTKRTTISYVQPVAAIEGVISTYFGLVDEVKIYDTDLTTVLKQSGTDYNLTSNYLSRRIIGLPSKVELSGRESSSLVLKSKVTYAYDENGYGGSGQSLSSATHHCTTTSSDCASAYGTSFSYRGNQTSTTRWNAEYPTSSTYAVSTSTIYNIAGSPISETDPRGRVSTVAYTDVWNDSVSRTTYAYPTTATDPGGFSSSIKYRFDTGANVWGRSPTPAGSGNTYGKTTSRVFSDTTGRVIKEMIDNTGAYTEFEYANTGNAMTTYTTVVDNDNDGADADDEVTMLTQFDGAGRTIRTRTENPNSGGDWTAVLTAYDIMGRVYSKSVPTEISVSGETWTVAGDDASRGFVYNKSYYDWKGRVIRTVPSDSTGTDGKDTLIAYTGCGCAGGQVTTISDPATTAVDVGGETQTNARRTQKVYEDILGRTYKTEIWDLDGAGSSPYSTTKKTFNGRDQATLVRKYSGADTSSTYQDATMTYDGHGRVLRKYLPTESGSTPYTAFTYNPDDTAAAETDARGAVKTYYYGQLDSHGGEDRALLTKIAYTPPSGIEDVPDVSFTYDAAGNRTEMAEATGGTGTTTYSYNEISQITSETKTFPSTWTYLTNSPGSGSRAYTISYNYFLNGAVKKVIDPFGDDIDYTVDDIGRMKTVTGDPWGYWNSVTNYVDNIDYRAWGTPGLIDFSNGLRMTQTFDNALRPVTHKIEKRLYADQELFDKTYSYTADGSLATSTEATEIRMAASEDFYRSYLYDFAGRLKSAKTGDEARDVKFDDRQHIPYLQNYTYDAFGNNTVRTGSVWNTGNEESLTWTPATNLVVGWNYDSAGNILISEHAELETTLTYTYNAAGSMLSAWQDNHHASSRILDGEQRPARISQSQGSENLANHLIYSTVFGKLLTETNATGGKDKTYVHDLNGSVIAVQQVTHYPITIYVAEVRWEHTDPSGASYFRSLHNGSFNGTEEAELDPLNSNVGIQAPNTESEIGSGWWGHPGYGGTQTCMMDWVLMDCNMMNRVLKAELAEVGPLDQFRLVQNPRSKVIVIGVFKNYGNGMAGWWADTDGPQPGDTDSVHIPYNSDRNAYHPSVHSRERVKPRTPARTREEKPCWTIRNPGINPLGVTADGVGGVGNGMVANGGTFRLTNGAFRFTPGVAGELTGSQFSPRLYQGGWGGGSTAGITTFGMKGVGSVLSRGTFALSAGLGGYNTFKSWEAEGWSQNTQGEFGSAVGGLAGGYAGGKYGAMLGGAIGFAVGPEGAPVGFVIGGVVGGVGGAYFGAHVGGETARGLYDRNKPRRQMLVS